jgi:hypothetical protein
VVKVNAGKSAQATNQEAGSSERKERDHVNPGDSVQLGDQSAEGLEAALLPHEKELLRELIQGLRGIRYGSFVLTVHEGRLVEIEKTVKIRRNRTKP